MAPLCRAVAEGALEVVVTPDACNFGNAQQEDECAQTCAVGCANIGGGSGQQRRAQLQSFNGEPAAAGRGTGAGDGGDGTPVTGGNDGWETKSRFRQVDSSQKRASRGRVRAVGKADKI